MKQKVSKMIQVKDLLSGEQFRKIESAFFRNFSLPLEITDIDGREIRSLCSAGCHPDFCRLVRDSKIGAGRCRQDRLRSLNIAIETGQPYTSLCHAGIALVCVPVMDGSLPLGGLFFGKCIWEPFDETLLQDVTKRLRGLRFAGGSLRHTLSVLPVVSDRKSVV